jgi:hypothetical protein
MSANVKKAPITEKTVFLRVSFGLPGNTKKIPQSQIHITADSTESINMDTSEITGNKATDYKAKLVKAQKTLLESPELEAIRTADGKIRTYLYTICLPWSMGTQLLPIGLLDTVNDRLEAYDDERKSLVDACIDAYPQRVADAIVSLGPLGNALDYLSSEAFRAKFTFDYEYQTISIPDALSEAIRSKANDKMQAKLAEASNEITLFMRQTMSELVSHLADVLTPNADGKPKRLFASAITNVQDFIDTFKDRDIAQDQDLEVLVNEVKGYLHSGVCADGLKKDESLKTQIAEQMAKISVQLKELVEVVPGRKIRDEV